MRNQWDISVRNVKLILLFFLILFLSCRTFEIPKKSQVIDVSLIFQDFALSNDWLRAGKICMVSHFEMKCRSLKNLHKKKIEDRYISDLRSYEDNMPSSMPKSPSYYGMSLQLEKKKMFALSGKINISSFKLSVKKQFGLFIIKEFPPHYLLLGDSSALFSKSADALKRNFFLEQYFRQSYDSFGKEIIDISETVGGKTRKIAVLNLDVTIENGQVLISRGPFD